MTTSTERNLITCIKNLAEINERLYDQIKELHHQLETAKSLEPEFNIMHRALFRISSGNIDAAGQTQIANEALGAKT